MTDFERLTNLLDELQIDYKVFSDPEYILQSALKAGAYKAVCIRGELDVAFNLFDETVGNYTNSSGSWRPKT